VLSVIMYFHIYIVYSWVHCLSHNVYITLITPYSCYGGNTNLNYTLLCQEEEFKHNENLILPLSTMTLTCSHGYSIINANGVVNQIPKLNKQV